MIYPESWGPQNLDRATLLWWENRADIGTHGSFTHKDRIRYIPLRQPTPEELERMELLQNILWKHTLRTLTQ